MQLCYVFVCLRAAKKFCVGVRLSRRFACGGLLHFILPSVIVVVFASVCNMISKLFISGCIKGATFTTIGLVVPFLVTVSTLNFVVNAKKDTVITGALNRNGGRRTGRCFSVLMCLALVKNVILSTLNVLFSPLVTHKLNTSNTLLAGYILCTHVALLSVPTFVLRGMFRDFFIATRGPGLNLNIVIVTNIAGVILSFLLMKIFRVNLTNTTFTAIADRYVNNLFPVLCFTHGGSDLLGLKHARFGKGVFLYTYKGNSSRLVAGLSDSVMGSLCGVRLVGLTKRGNITTFKAVVCMGFVFVTVFLKCSVKDTPLIDCRCKTNGRSRLGGLFRGDLQLVKV